MSVVDGKFTTSCFTSSGPTWRETMDRLAVNRWPSLREIRSVISPVLSNVFLHYVLDEWFAEQAQPRLRHGSMLVRYCDDFVMLFASRDDAERVQAVLGKRLAKFGLEIHPDKTRLVDFRLPTERVGVETRLPTTFTFLGFLHIWSKTYPRESSVVHWTRGIWRKWLSRRSWTSYVTWEKFLRLVDRYPLPAPRIVHRYT